MTNCATTAEPDFEDFESLIKSCYTKKKCANLEVSACDYMNDSLGGVLEDIFKSENGYQGYEFNILVLDNSSSEIEVLYYQKEGNCTSSSVSGSNKIATSDRKVNLDVSMRLCD
jgi:hypothetical protein